MKFATSRCHDVDHPEIEFEIFGNGIPEEFALEFLGTLEELVAGGSRFQPGQTIQVGWMPLQFAANSKDPLTLCEPDMRSIPVVFIPGITETLRQRMLQVFFIESFDLPRSVIDFPSIDQTAVVCTRFEESEGLVLARTPPSTERDSGWFLGCLEDDHDHNVATNLKLTPLYAAYLARKAIASWIVFPAESVIEVSPGSPPRVLLEEEPLEIRPGSFIDVALDQNLALDRDETRDQ